MLVTLGTESFGHHWKRKRGQEFGKLIQQKSELGLGTTVSARKAVLKAQYLARGSAG